MDFKTALVIMMTMLTIHQATMNGLHLHLHLLLLPILSTAHQYAHPLASHHLCCIHTPLAIQHIMHIRIHTHTPNITTTLQPTTHHNSNNTHRLPQHHQHRHKHSSSSSSS